MSQGMIGADAEGLERAVLELRSAADELDQHETWLTSSLNSVTWLGDVATRFLDTWAGGHRARIRSTADFIRENADLLQQQSEQQRETSGGTGDGGGGNGDGGGGNGDGGGGDSSSDPSQDLPDSLDDVPVDDSVFDADNMYDSIDNEVEGANDPELNQALEDLLADQPDPGSPEAQELLETIAEIRGVDVADLQADYEQYVHLAGLLEGHDIPSIDLNQHPDFVGSTWSLTYGQVVGDALGIDPVFGALLNPTGGIVGPGNDQLYNPGPGDPLGYHGSFHDAGGFLLNHFGEGPGYTYAPGAVDGPKDHHYSGQASGIAFWSAAVEANALQQEWSDLADDVGGLVKDGGGLVKDGWDWLTK